MTREIAFVNECVDLPIRERPVIIDAMLGWVARWLRMLGVDSIYDPCLSDVDLLRINRPLITRDRELYRRRAYTTVFLNTQDKTLWLSALSLVFGVDLRINVDESRCPICGCRLVKAGREAVVGKVPRRVLERYGEFWVCTCCGKAYWVGRHHTRIREELERASRLRRSLIVDCNDGYLSVILE